MSIKATNWAWSQRGLKPSAKVVLLGLADRYNPDQGCFPSIARLAEDCEMSERSVQDQIDKLKQLGLIRVEKMPRKGGRLPLNRYRLAFEDDFQGGEKVAEQTEKPPSAKSAYGKKTASPSAKSAAHLRQNLPTNLVREPKENRRAEPARAALSCIEVTEEGLGLSRWAVWLAAHGLPALGDIPALKKGAMRGGYMLPCRFPPSDGFEVSKVMGYLQAVAGLHPSIAENGRVG